MNILKLNRKKKILFSLIIGILFTLSPTIVNLFNCNRVIREEGIKNHLELILDNKILKTSAVSGKIHIDNNWTAVKAVGDCKGNGTYQEPYIIEDLIINGGGLGSCILIENSVEYFIIENCTIYNSGDNYPSAGINLNNVINAQLISNNCSSNYRGIYLTASNNNSVLNNFVNKSYDDGMYITQSNTLIISNNTINNNNDYGIYMTQSFNNIISNNTINYCNDEGIYLYYSDYNNISGNSFRYSDSGIYLSHSDSNTIVGNDANNNYYSGTIISESYWTEIMDNSVIENRYGINCYQSYNSLVSGNIAKDNNYGIYMYNTHTSDILGNDASNNLNRGIYLFLSDFNNVSGNNAIENGNTGIELYYSDYNSVSENDANSNNDSGINLSSSNNNTVSKNFANLNGRYGISIYSSDRNTILENNASYNFDSGIRLFDCEHNSILGNTIRENTYYGVHLSESRNNNIEHNFIRINQIGIYEEYTRYKKYLIEIFSTESTSNQISNNIFNNNYDNIRKEIRIIPHPFEELLILLLTILSIVTAIIAIGAITTKLMNKQKEVIESGEHRFRYTDYGLRAIIVELIGALIFIPGSLFLIPINSFLFWCFILIPFAVIGIALSRKGLRWSHHSHDVKKSMAIVGMIFGIPLLVLGALLIVIVIVIVIVILAIIYAIIVSGG